MKYTVILEIIHEGARISHAFGIFAAKLTQYISRKMSIKNVPFRSKGGGTDSKIINSGGEEGESEYGLPAGMIEVVIIEKNKNWN